MKVNLLTSNNNSNTFVQKHTETLIHSIGR